MRSKPKYGNKRTVVDGVKFDSRKEARRWAELKLLERAGEISNLRRQVRYELIPAQRDRATKKVVERNVVYVADFVYVDAFGSTVVEDTKGMRTPAYVIKRKLMLQVHGIKIREV